jgi:hypothetical protein
MASAKYSSKGSDAAGCTGQDALSGAYRASKSDIGSAARPAGAPGPESKGSISYPKEAGYVKNPSKTG